MNRTFRIHCSQIGKIMGTGKNGLPVTCQTFLKEWYANDREQIHSKYIDKGNWVEADLIDFMAEQLGLGMAEKNEATLSDEFFVGTADVVTSNMVIDVKAPWNVKTLQDNVGGINTDYEWQLRGYMRLWDKSESIVFYGLMDTPAEANYDREVIYSDMPDNERWIAYSVTRDHEVEQSIIDRVVLCREWLNQYDQLIKAKMGRVNQ